MVVLIHPILVIFYEGEKLPDNACHEKDGGLAHPFELSSANGILHILIYHDVSWCKLNIINTLCF